MLANYSFIRYKDTYILTNTDTNLALAYSLTKQIDCGEYITTQIIGIVAKSSVFEIPIPFDGDYQLTLSRGSDSLIISIRNYLTLQKGLLFNLRQAICGFSTCRECEQQGLDDCVTYQGLFTQIIGYQYLIKPYSDVPSYCTNGSIFDAFLHQAIELNKCVIAEELYEQLQLESVISKITNAKELTLYLSTIYYLGFYFYERLLAIDADEEAYVDAKYYWSQIQVCIKKQGININDLREVFINIVSSSNIAPTVSGVAKTFMFDPGNQYTYTFSSADFTSNFHDDNGDQPNMVKLMFNPLAGRLYFNGSPINAEGYIFPIGNASRLTYVYSPTVSNPTYDLILFKINDTNTTPIYSDMATIAIAVSAYVNQPPDHVGNNSLALSNRVNRVFTMADFTTNTTPPYHDPEGDGVYQLRIDTLPSIGTLKVSGSPASSGQIISASIITTGAFEYDAPNQDAAASVSFNFSLADTGSHQFTS